MPEAQPSGTNVPSGIISISQYTINTVRAQGKAERLLFLVIILMLQMYPIID